METALLACLYILPIVGIFALMAWVADWLERKPEKTESTRDRASGNV